MITREQKLVVKYYSYNVVNQESHKRYANNNEIDARVLSVFGDQIVKTAGITGIFKKLKDLYKAFQKAPKLWTKFKQQLGIKGKNTFTKKPNPLSGKLSNNSSHESIPKKPFKRSVTFQLISVTLVHINQYK